MRRYVVPLLVLALAAPLSARTPEETAAAALKAAPVWDGHNDVAEQLRTRRRDVIADFNFNDTTHEPDGKGGTKTMHTDLPRLAKGHVGAQFWSVYVSANLPEPEAVVATMEQIDVMKRLIARYPDRLQLALTSADVERARGEGATDREIHDTVLIAAAFCMFNRYVDGLATWTPDDPAMYDMMGERLATVGYLGARERAERDS